MGNGMNCKKKGDKGKMDKKKTDENLFNRAKTVRAEEIMRKSVWFIEKEEVDNYFSREELAYYKKHQLSKKFTELLIPTVPAEIKWKEGEIIGQGAFGQVIMGFNEDNGQIMAVKQINLKILNKDEERISALEMEIEILKELQHENIVKYIGTQKTQNKLLIFLEYLSGGSLSSLLRKYGKLNETIIRIYTTQILQGLEYLHYKNVMHRDIKGANILLETGGVCKLADFGSSKQLSELNEYNTLIGTANWMPPEVIKQTKGGRFSDIWSFGCTLIEMATGKPPWSDVPNSLQVMFKIANNEHPPPFPTGISKEFQNFLENCLQIDPFKRFNCYKLLRHPFITGVAPMIKTPNVLTVERRDLRELSNIVEREENISESSFLTPKNRREESQKLVIESEMEYHIKTNESPGKKNLGFLKVNTANSVFESDFNLNNNATYNEKPKISITSYEGEMENSISEGDIQKFNNNYTFRTNQLVLKH